MTPTNVQIVAGVVEALSADDMEACWSDLDSEIEVHDFDLPDAGVYHGHEGFLRWLSDWGEPWDDYGWEGHDYLEVQDKVADCFELRARAGDLETRRRNAIVWTLRDGKITRLEYYATEAEARAAAGIPSSSS